MNYGILNIKKRQRKSNIKKQNNYSENLENQIRDSPPIDIPEINNIQGKITNSKMKTNREYLKKYIMGEYEFYNFPDLLEFFDKNYDLDYQNQSLKDDIKLKFKEELNLFLKEYCKVISRKNLILVKKSYVEQLFHIIVKYIDLKTDVNKMMMKFNHIIENVQTEEIKEELELLKGTAFICENSIKTDDLYKKRNGQYLKYKTIPKWHHYAWDMINQISNSRKSFIFSKFIEEDELNEYSRKKIDLDTIILKLKLKIYNNIYEFIDDIMKMLKYSVEYMQRMNHPKNSSFCKLMEARLQKQIKKLKEDNKI